MATRDEVAQQPLEQRRARLARTADDLTAAIRGETEAVLARRPDAASWAAIEVVCHLRDIEEMALLRLEVMAALDEPVIAATGMGARILAQKPDGQPAAPDRWARDRQYLRNDPNTASRTGYQVNIGRGAAGEFCGGIYTTDWLAKGDETDTVRKPKEWNALGILAKGAHIQVELNGKKIVDMVDPKPDPKFLQKGVIGFQTYGAEGHDGWVKFRSIRLRELTK